MPYYGSVKITKPKIKKHIDYLKIYNDIVNPCGVADVSLVKVRQILEPYVSRLIEWNKPSVFPYALTISPKSSPLLKNKSIKAQYDIMTAFMRQTFPKYCNKYFTTFELYHCGEYIHAHGLINFSTLESIKVFKKEVKQFFNIQTKKGETDKLNHVKLLGNDDEARKRWMGYMLAEMSYSVKLEFPPIFRWDDTYFKPLALPKKTKSIFYIPDMTFIKVIEQPPYKRPEVEEIVMESESEEDAPYEDFNHTEYLEYKRLKEKYQYLSI